MRRTDTWRRRLRPQGRLAGALRVVASAVILVGAMLVACEGSARAQAMGQRGDAPGAFLKGQYSGPPNTDVKPPSTGDSGGNRSGGASGRSSDFGPHGLDSSTGSSRGGQGTGGFGSSLESSPGGFGGTGGIGGF